MGLVSYDGEGDTQMWRKDELKKQGKKNEMKEVEMQKGRTEEKPIIREEQRMGKKQGKERECE
jgi:hypothetical protein